MDPETKLPISAVTPEYMNNLPDLIMTVATELQIAEQTAVSVTGAALKLTNLALSAKQITQMVDSARRKQLTELSPGDRELLFAGGWLVRTNPFEGSAGTVGRNAPCPCKSGKKYKNCCLEYAKTHDNLRYSHGK